MAKGASSPLRDHDRENPRTPPRIRRAHPPDRPREAEKAKGWEERERLRQAAERARAGRLSRIDELAVDDQPQLFGISSDAQSDRLRFFLRLSRCLLWLFRCWRWTLFKDNLSFPGNVGADDLLSKPLQIEFDIGDSLFQVLCSSGICWFLSELPYCREVDSFLRNFLSREHSTRAHWHDRAR
jgi:hypothetical protein